MNLRFVAIPEWRHRQAPLAAAIWNKVSSFAWRLDIGVGARYLNFTLLRSLMNLFGLRFYQFFVLFILVWRSIFWCYQHPMFQFFVTVGDKDVIQCVQGSWYYTLDWSAYILLESYLLTITTILIKQYLYVDACLYIILQTKI